MEKLHTFADLYRYIEKNHSNPKAFNYLDQDNQWESVSTGLFLSRVKNIALGLSSLGLKNGEKVGILAPPSPHWHAIDFAIILSGGVSVPLFSIISDKNFLFEIEETELRFIFISGQDEWEMFDKHEDHFKLAIDVDGVRKGNKIINYQELMRKGETLASEEKDLFESLLNNGHPDDLATIVYTSGSTGYPKGAEITQFCIAGTMHVDPFSWSKEKDSFLNLLPLAHIFARTLSIIMVVWGIPIYYLNDLHKVGKVCQEIHPTLMIVVPRLLEKVYAKMLAKVQSAGFLQKKLGQWAFDLANNEEDPLYKQLLHPIADKIVYSALRDAMGGKFRVIISGGAALNPHLYHFFLEIGLPIYEGWGMTECSIITTNRPGGIKIGTVGTIVDGVEVKIDPSNSELLVKGTRAMRGYYKNPEATALTIDKEGWIHTGDKGEMDDNGFIRLTGRVKDMFKTSTGEYVVPSIIEQMFVNAPLIDMALVIGERRKFCSCLLYPDLDVLKSLKKTHNVIDMSNEEFLNGDFVKKEMDNLIELINEKLNRWEKIHGYAFITETPSVEGGELTPTMKLNREVIEQKYSNLIEKIYQPTETIR